MGGFAPNRIRHYALWAWLAACLTCPALLYGQEPATEGHGQQPNQIAALPDDSLAVQAQPTQPAQPAQPAQPVQPGQPSQQPAQPPGGADQPPAGGSGGGLGVFGSPLPGVGGGDQGGKATTTITPGPSTGGDAGAALGNSNAATGVEVQRRAPLSVDPRIRGYHVGQIVTFADWAFWTPARIDLDTALGKIDPDNIASIAIIKGPFSARYGPGFAFLDVETLPTPRSKTDCFEAQGITNVLYRTNGQAFAGRQYISGANKDWGFRLGYDLQAGNDYAVGGGNLIPTSYNSQNVDFAFGFDLAEHCHLEIKYLRQMQHDVEYPGLLTDIDQLNTDGFAMRYLEDKACWFDKLTMDVWYNTTTFTGDSSRAGKRYQIPQLNAILINTPGGPNQSYFNAGGSQVRLDLTTADNLYTWGLRDAVTWGEDKCVQLTVGADLSVTHQGYNEFDSFNFSVTQPVYAPSNFGIPATRLVDPGIFADGSLPIGQCLTLRAGTRVDIITTDLIHLGYNMDPNLYFDPAASVGPAALNTQHFTQASGYATAEYKLTEEVKVSGGYGYAERPPMLTELYTGGAFFGLIQNGFNAIYGNPSLHPEQLHQLDLGTTAKYECMRAGAHGFFSWVEDYITYQPSPFPINPSGQFTIPKVQFAGQEFNLQTVIREYRFKNTSLATLWGYELYGEYDLMAWLTPFATLSYVQGFDEEIVEPLPGIAPMEGRVGWRIHDPEKNPKWAIEMMARLVSGQELVATSLGEQHTGGFTVFNIRGFWQARDNLLLTAGVENLADRAYQEHLDLRTGRGVYQPGINFYFGMRINY